MRRGYKWVDRELAAMDPESDWERMISLYAGHRIPEFGLAMMIYPGTMRMMQSSMTAATLAHTSKLETKPHRRFQDGNTRTMVHGVARIVSYLSGFMTLEPGDVISTGTPPGVGLGMKPPVYLRAGQTMRLSVEGLGEQRQVTVQGA